MKALTIMTYVGAAGLAVCGVTMAKTNPSQPEYEEYAMQRLTQYLKQDVCNKTSRLIENLLHSKCDKLVDSANPQIKDILAATTQRQDFVVFSVYRTDLKVSAWLPSYKFETVGAFNNFYTYSAEQQ
ncbi:DUF4359 domain-containing protein [Nostocaceae cyanobacterium CENA369]|uniref:DUF4359 domain-containing protein n=1 Tax=Dendronalium phyllosphericum CENA369 TaxID=1725256 RepID=A0A8J7I248_9NOST|nr:DUF4359 domain-containing protein [Dendronalium phyllosphericum]MBH8574306.1 DUF4359 domain-containing protein [Dendronalium phyllosphericum CENA369]